MKRFFASIIVLFAIVAMPGKADAQFRYGAIAGVNISDLSFSQDLISVSPTVGYTAGVQAEMIFPGIGFGIDMGLLYNQLGADVNLGEKEIWASEGYGSERQYLHYVQVPFHFRFKWTRMGGLEEKIAPFAYAGPDLTLLVGHGKCDAMEYAGGDVGLTVGLGFELFERWQLSGSYTWGMTYSLKTVLLDDFSARNRHWSVRLTYFFE